MLSPHELSTLILIKHAAQTGDLEREEIDVLVRQRLIFVDVEQKRTSLTPYGDRLLEVLLTWPGTERMF
jgi:hypothetical protein